VHRFQVRELAPHGEIELLVLQRLPEVVDEPVATSSLARWPLADLNRERLLLTETHHRIQNHLQLISSLLNLQNNSLDQDSVRHALRSSQNRVRAIAALHQHLYQIALGQEAPFEQFVEGVISRLRECYQVPDTQVIVTTELEKLKLLEEWVMPVALIINEAVSNSFKHAFSDGRTGCLQVSLRRNGDKVSLRVQDDGAGLPADFDPERDEGLGFKVISVFADQMGGRFSVENIASSGVAFDLQFPITCVDI
jgi:two-component sensor histidine kinase